MFGWIVSRTWITRICGHTTVVLFFITRHFVEIESLINDTFHHNFPCEFAALVDFTVERRMTSCKLMTQLRAGIWRIGCNGQWAGGAGEYLFTESWPVNSNGRGALLLRWFYARKSSSIEIYAERSQKWWNAQINTEFLTDILMIEFWLMFWFFVLWWFDELFWKVWK